MFSIKPALSYASLARDEARYQAYLESLNPEKEDFFDDKGVLIFVGDYFYETTEGIFSKETVENIGKENDLKNFTRLIFGEEKEIPEWAAEYFEDGDYTGLAFEMDRDCCVRN